MNTRYRAHWILAVKAADDVYNETSTTITMTVAKATPTIQNNPSVNGANVGQVLSEFSLSDLTASVVDRKPLAGSFAWENPQMVIQGSGKHVAIFTSADDNYNSISCEVQVNLDTTDPEIVFTRVTPSINGARLEVSATAGTPLTYQWQVKGSWIDIPGATTAAFDYTGLFPNTEYTVRVIVTDANGNSTTSDSITFRTGKQAVSFIITNNTDSQTSKITSGTSPNTGDNSMLFLYLTLFVVGIAGITWRVVWNKKHKAFSEKKKD